MSGNQHRETLPEDNEPVVRNLLDDLKGNTYEPVKLYIGDDRYFSTQLQLVLPDRITDTTPVLPAVDINLARVNAILRPSCKSDPCPPNTVLREQLHAVDAGKGVIKIKIYVPGPVDVDGKPIGPASQAVREATLEVEVIRVTQAQFRFS